MNGNILINDIKTKSFKRLYYIHGHEQYLKDYYYSEIKKKAVSSMREFNIIEFDSKALDLSIFSDTINSYPVMGEYKLIGVIDFDNSIIASKEKKETLKSILKNIPPFSIVVFFDTALKDEQKSTPLSQLVVSAGGADVVLDKPAPSNLAAWLKRIFKSYDKQILQDDLYYFMETADSDMLALKNEAKKLCQAVEDVKITKEDIDNIVTKSIDANRFEITDALYSRNFDKLFSVIDKLYKQGCEHLDIANVFYRAFIDMYRARSAMEEGISSKEMADDFKINVYGAAKVMKNVQNMRMPYLIYCLNRCWDLDLSLKSARLGGRELITAFIYDITAKLNE